MERKNNIEVTVEGKYLYLTKGKKSYRYEINKISERLRKCTNEQLKNFKLSAGGYGIHWPDADEDLSIPSLLMEPKAEYKIKK